MTSVGRLADPLRRAEARADPGKCPRAGGDSVSRTFSARSKKTSTAAVPTAAALAAIARSLGPELSCNWRHWIARLTAGADEVWAAVAGSWLDRGETRTTGLWEALAEIRDHRLVLGLITRIGEIDQGEIGEIFGKIASLFGEEPDIPPAELWPPFWPDNSDISLTLRPPLGSVGRPASPSPGPWSSSKTAVSCSRAWPRPGSRYFSRPSRIPRRRPPCGSPTSKRDPTPPARPPRWRRSAACRRARPSFAGACASSKPAPTNPFSKCKDRSGPWRHISTSCGTTRRPVICAGSSILRTVSTPTRSNG